MASSDEAEVFDVERILAERIEDGITKYLVKWQNYPDDQCTWEPVESFDTTETLATWNKQKELGDVLEADDLQRIQRQMDAYQAAQDEDASSQHSSEGQSDFDLEQTQPAKKKVRMVHDPPPLSNRTRNPNNPVRPDPERRKAGSNHKLSSTRPLRTSDKTTGNRVPSSKPKTVKSEIQSQRNPPKETAPRTRPSSGVSGTTGSKSRPIPASNSLVTFHAPDLNSRKSRTASTSQSRRQPTEQHFKTLRHVNNVKKRQADKYYYEMAPAVPTEDIKSTQEGVQANGAVQRPSTEQNNSWSLFFSDDDIDDIEESDPENNQDILRKVEADTNNNTDNIAGLSNTKQLIDDVTMLETSNDLAQPLPVEGQAVEQQQSIETAEAVLHHQRPKDNRGLASINLPQSTFATGRHEDRSYAEENFVITSSTPIANNIIVPSVNSPISAVSDQHRTAQTSAQREDNVVLSASPNNDQNVRISVNRTDSRRYLSDLPLELNMQYTNWQSRKPGADMPTHSAQQYIAPQDIVRVSTGREWVNGDLVVELFLTGHLAGGINIQNFQWEARAPIIRLKLKNEHNLPLHFNNVLSYDEYRNITAVSSWWTIYAISPVESFPDSVSSVSSAAEYLEKNDLAAYWMHPSENIMLILYSCRSPSWQNFQALQSTRSGEVRLQIVSRNKIQIPQSDATNNQLDTRSPDQRVRRPSLITGTTKSLSERLAQDLAESSLSASNRRNSESFEPQYRSSVPLEPTDQRRDNVDDLTRLATHKENLSTTTSKDPRLFNSRQQSTLSDENIPSEARKDALLVETSSRQVLQTGSISGSLDRDAQQLALLPKSAPSRIDRNDIRIILFYHTANSLKARAVQEWLSTQTPTKDHVLLQPATLEPEKNYNIWTIYKSHVRSSACVLICDSLRLVTEIPGLSKLLESDNLVCWLVDLENEIDQSPMRTQRLFPTGIAMAVTQKCFLLEPSSTIILLRGLKCKAEKPYSASRLLLPPNITTVIQEQALLSQDKEIKKQFLELLTLIQDFTILSETQRSELLDLGFCLLPTKWEEVYPVRIKRSPNDLSELERGKREQSMADEFGKYFDAWAILNLSHHRRFIAIITSTKPSEHQHVRWRLCKEFAEYLNLQQKASSEHQLHNRGRRTGRDSANSPKEVRNRSGGR